jgi:hypothetical protein
MCLGLKKSEIGGDVVRSIALSSSDMSRMVQCCHTGQKISIYARLTDRTMCSRMIILIAKWVYELKSYQIQDKRTLKDSCRRCSCQICGLSRCFSWT